MLWFYLRKNSIPLEIHASQPLTFFLSLLLFIASCVQKKDGSRQIRPSGAAAFKVGLVFDVGGRGDKSFNDAAFAGLERAAKDFSLKLEYIEPVLAQTAKPLLSNWLHKPKSN